MKSGTRIMRKWAYFALAASLVLEDALSDATVCSGFPPFISSMAPQIVSPAPLALLSVDPGGAKPDALNRHEVPLELEFSGVLESFV